MRFIISPSKKHCFLICVFPSSPCPLLFRLEPKALGVHQGQEGFKHTTGFTLSIFPCYPATSELKRTLPPSLPALLFLLGTGPPEASDILPRENQTNPNTATPPDGFQPQVSAFPSSIRKKACMKYSFPVDHQSSLQGIPRGSSRKTRASYHPCSSRERRYPSCTIGPPPEHDVALCRASLRQSQGQVMIHHIHPLRYHHRSSASQFPSSCQQRSPGKVNPSSRTPHVQGQKSRCFLGKPTSFSW